MQTHVLPQSRPWVSIMVALGTLLSITALWQYASYKPGMEDVISRPTTILRYLVAIATSGGLLDAVLKSAWRTVPASIESNIAALVCAAGFVLFPLVHRTITWITRVLLGVSTLAVFLWFVRVYELGDQPKIMLCRWIVFLYMFAHLFFRASSWLYEGTESYEQTEQLQAARVDGAGRWGLFWYMLVPMLLPHAYTASLVTIAIEWKLLVFAESLAPNGGVGYMIFQSQDVGTTALVAWTIVLSLCAVCHMSLAHIAYRFCMPWNR